MKKILILGIAILTLLSMKNDKPAYRLFESNGNKTSYKDMLKEASEADIVFFGELHDNPICHWLEYEITADLYAERGKNLILGAEMFESDNQLIVNEYLAKLIKDKNFEAEARLWPNYKTDYKRLLDFARDSSLAFIATNVPRRYASMVNATGFDALNTLDKNAYQFIAPIPIKYDSTLSCYADMYKMMGDAPTHATRNIACAQATKDATMAHFILQNFIKGKTFLHFNGSYHSDRFQSILWYLKQADPSLKIITISSVEQTDLDALDKESEGLANFIIAIPETMSKTK
ncbi:MAG: ChaN family lipoprotein [Bacteroidales bacterium]